MSTVPVTLACWDYDRTRALADGTVRPAGVALTYLNLPVEETFFRMLRHREFDVRQRWQTKRGYPGFQHIVDWMTLDVSATYFPNSVRDNFSQPFAFLEYDYVWNVGDRTGSEIGRRVRRRLKVGVDRPRGDRKAANVAISETETATTGIMVARRFRRKMKTTTTTSNTASTRVRSTSRKDVRMVVERSTANATSIAGEIDALS